uniref:Potassium channel domain-containing protein n=1 Tax=Amphora coffeiformis TaxID=265554 RepID=A0A7S3L012_9STRA
MMMNRRSNNERNWTTTKRQRQRQMREETQGEITTPPSNDNDDEASAASSSNHPSVSPFVLDEAIFFAQDLTGSEGRDRRRRRRVRDQSQIEFLAQRIEERRANRIPVPFVIRKTFVKECYHIAVREGYKDHDRIHLEDLYAMRDEKIGSDNNDDDNPDDNNDDNNPGEDNRSKNKRRACRLPSYVASFLIKLGFFDHYQVWNQLFDRAEQVVKKSHLRDEKWFYYRDFVYYHTNIVSYWPWTRNATRESILYVALFYIATGVWFCHVVHDEQICPVDPTSQQRPYYGWTSALYFASTTMSTVGYGDLVVEKTDDNLTDWRSSLYGVAYMMTSLLVAIMFLRAVADMSFRKLTQRGPVRDVMERAFQTLTHWVMGRPRPDDHLYVQIRRLRFQLLSKIVAQFSLLNLIGIFVSRFFVNRYADETGENWNWMTSFYWAIQTTTTIGYGDLNMPFELRWFQIIYLALSTYFASNALGRLGTLGVEAREAKRRYAWGRKGASTGTCVRAWMELPRFFILFFAFENIVSTLASTFLT